MTTELTIKGMHCDACEKTIQRSFEKNGIIVKSISWREGTARIEKQNHSDDDIARLLSIKGYSLVTESKQKRIKLSSAERSVLTNGFLTLVLLLLAQTLLLLFVYPIFEGFNPKHSILFVALPIAVGLNMLALWHHRAYQSQTSCMSGMMIGMTLGMMSGFMIGALVGLANGMFIGGIVGAIIGILAGVYAGYCCGIMGVMEGMMAGLMGGTMGSMLTVMMVADHPITFIIFLYIVCTAILLGMIFMVIEQNGGDSVEMKPWTLADVLTVSFALMLIVSAVMIMSSKGLF